MKKPFIALVLSCFLYTAYGQDEKINIGIKAGVNFASVSEAGGASGSFGANGASYTNKTVILFHAGGYSEIRVNDFFSVQPELLFSMKGGGNESKVTLFGDVEEATNNYNFSYLEVPLLLRFNLGKGFNITGGPYFGFLLAAKSKTKTYRKVGSLVTTTESESDKDDFKTVDVGMSTGVGYQLENGLNFSVKWVRGFSSIHETGNITQSNNVFQLSVGFNLASF